MLLINSYSYSLNPRGRCPEFMNKNQKRNQANDPWYIPAIPTGKSDFGAPNCPVRALRYYHRYITEHPVEEGQMLFVCTDQVQ